MKLPHLDMEGLQGREIIVGAWLEAMKMFLVNMMAMPGVITVDGDRADAQLYHEVAVMQDGTELRPRGQYDDECVKVDGEWKFSRRVFKVLHGE